MSDMEMQAEQTADIEAAWVNARIYTKDTANDTYHEVVVSRGGTVLDEYYLSLTEDGESREDLHRLKSRKGTRILADDLEAEFPKNVAGKYNTLTREIKA